MIVIEQSENPDYRRYYTRFKITDGYHIHGLYGRLPIQELLDETVPGLIETPTLDGYRLLVQKVPTFTWEEIDAKLLPFLHELNASIGCTSREVQIKNPIVLQTVENKVEKG